MTLLGFASHESSAATAEPRHVGGKAATDNLKTNGHGFVPRKLYLQNLWKVSFDTGAAICPSLQSSPPEYNKVSWSFLSQIQNFHMHSFTWLKNYSEATNTSNRKELCDINMLYTECHVTSLYSQISFFFHYDKFYILQSLQIHSDVFSLTQNT